MTTSHVEPLCTIEIRHGYFADGRCRVLELRPTTHCLRLIERYRLCWVPAPDGGALHYWVTDADQRGASVLSRLFDEVTPFGFTLVSGDPEFERYTAGAYAWEQMNGSNRSSVASFSNLANNAGEPAGANQSLLLHDRDRPLAARLEIRSRGVLTRTTAGGGSREPEVVTALGDLLQGSWTRGAASAGAIDLRTLPEGRFGIREQGETLVDAWWGDPTPPAPFGVVELFPGGPGMRELPTWRALLDGRRQPVPRHFRIELSPRSTTWRYYVLSATAAPLDMAELLVTVEAGADVSFTNAAPASVGGRSAAVFESTSALQLNERPDPRLNVVLALTGRRPMTLPHPRPDSTRLESHGAGVMPRFVSEVFVYV